VNVGEQDRRATVPVVATIVARAARMALTALLLAAACGKDAPSDANVARGRGLQPVALAPESEAQVYAAAVRAGFDPDPSLVLMLHPLQLPRGAGYDSGSAVPPALASALRARGVVKGTCEPIRDGARTTPRCPMAQPGYLIRATPVFRLKGDTVQMNFYAEQFAGQSGLKPQALRFEKIYQLVGRGDSWRVVREARVPDPVK
jgi:hypothetical protein